VSTLLPRAHHRAATVICDGHNAGLRRDQGAMTSHLHSAVVRRIAVPAWLLAVVIAAVIAAGLFAALDRPATPAPVHNFVPSTCVDATLAGHC
jgi:hypothetical protein